MNFQFKKVYPLISPDVAEPELTLTDEDRTFFIQGVLGFCPIHGGSMKLEKTTKGWRTLCDYGEMFEESSERQCPFSQVNFHPTRRQALDALKFAQLLRR